MLQIKTIRDRLDYASFFDNEVNAALRDGFDSEKSIHRKEYENG